MPDAPEINRRREEHRRNIAQRIREVRQQFYLSPREELNKLARLIITTEQAKSIRPEAVLQEAAELQATAIYTLNNTRWHEEQNTGVNINTQAAQEQRRTAEQLSAWATAQLKLNN